MRHFVSPCFPSLSCAFSLQYEANHLQGAPLKRPRSPPGIPDWHTFPGKGLSGNLLKDPVLVKIAQDHKKTPAQVAIRWHWYSGIPVNPR